MQGALIGIDENPLIFQAQGASTEDFAYMRNLLRIDKDFSPITMYVSDAFQSGRTRIVYKVQHDEFKMPTHVTHQEIDDVQVLTIGSETVSINEDNLEEISQQLLDLAVSISPQIIIDMRHVEFYGSSFIETLFRIWNRIKSIPEGFFAITGLQSYCREILSVTNLDSVWNVYDTNEEAIAACKAK